jgi:hypothetical protein
MHTIHNARITLLATAFNNLALAVVVAGASSRPPLAVSCMAVGKP